MRNKETQRWLHSKRNKNIALMIVLVNLATLFFVMTIVRVDQAEQRQHGANAPPFQPAHV